MSNVFLFQIVQAEFDKANAIKQVSFMQFSFERNLSLFFLGFTC
jgi:hypothetical protein